MQVKLCVWLLTSGVYGEIHEAITQPIVRQACDRCLRHWRYNPCTAVMDKHVYWVWTDGVTGERLDKQVRVTGKQTLPLSTSL